LLTVLEANFIQEYKRTKSPTKALRAAGYTASEKSLPVIAYRMLRKPHIKSVLEEYRNNLNKAVTEPVLMKVKPVNNTKEGIVKANIPIVAVPSKDVYVETAWKRSSDESRLKEETKYKYFENAGKVLGYVGKDSSEQPQSVFNMFIKELRLDTSNGMPEMVNNISGIIGHSDQTTNSVEPDKTPENTEQSGQ
jgi:phage terminase small subunit